ncbi:low molecular weight phosphatase family protein [Spirosoma flavus]
MKLFSLLPICLLITTTIFLSNDPDKKTELNGPLVTYINSIKQGFSKIPQDRKAELDKIAEFVQLKVNAKEPAQLTYICTHNSRRSHFGQLWAATAAAYYGVPRVKTFSGGTEVSAFNERAIAACKRAGFDIAKVSEGPNPTYAVNYASGVEPIKTFSKKYDDASNPQSNFLAIMTCSQADKACPIVKGAAVRVATPYDDPKAFDGTPQETAKYDERCKQIATETFYVFSKVKVAI